MAGRDSQAGGGSLVPPPNAACFKLKFWIEASRIDASISSVTLTRVPVWPKGDALEHVPAAEDPKLQLDNGLTLKPDGTTSLLALEEGAESAGLHFNNPVELREGLRVLLPVLQLPPGCSVSVQALCWNKSGEGRSFLGQMNLISGIAEAADYDVKIPSEMEDGKQPKFITLKVWVIGKPGRPVRIGAVRFGSPSAK